MAPKIFYTLRDLGGGGGPVGPQNLDFVSKIAKKVPIDLNIGQNIRFMVTYEFTKD